MTKTITTLFISLFAYSTFAQITDDDAIARAQRILGAIAPEHLEQSASVYRDTDTANDYSVPIIHVSFGEAVVWLHPAGGFAGFADMSIASMQPTEGGPDIHQDDNEAWDALERVLDRLDVPAGLTRKSFKREASVGQPFVMRFVKHPKPFGYEAEGGNSVQAGIHRVTGKILSLSISRGWSYEEPNIRITQQRAVAAACSTIGGAPEEWTASLKYSTVGRIDALPHSRALHNSRTMRLLYAVDSSLGYVLVDSVTGDVVDLGRTAGSHASGSQSKAGSKDETTSEDSPLSTNADGTYSGEIEAADKQQESSDQTESPLVVILISVGAVLAVGSGVIYFKSRGFLRRSA